MAKFDEKVAALMAKHPSLPKEEATKIITEKIQRKKTRRAEKAERSHAKILKNESRVLAPI